MAGSDSEVHKNHRSRMRAKFCKTGFDGFLEHEILEMLLYYSIPRVDTNPLAHKILKKYKTLANVFDATPDELMKETGVSDLAGIGFISSIIPVIIIIKLPINIEFI